jgi:Fe-S-cluster containining protein
MNDEPPLDPAEFRDDLHAIYGELGADVAKAGPVCALSGRCCRFAEYGHTLFLSEPEFVLLLADAPPPVRPLDDGETCPWQDDQGRCTAHQARPLGCRVYFCDDSYGSHSHDLSERHIGGLKRLVAARGMPWNYAPLHHHLRRALEEGRFINHEEHEEL